VETQFVISLDLGYLTKENHGRLLSDLIAIKAKLAGLERSLAHCGEYKVQSTKRR
jgi:hypothetical protein